MAIATFGTKVFQVDTKKIYTFNSLSHSSSLETEAQEVEGKKPSTYIKGEGLGTLSFVIPLERAYGLDPRTEWESWENILAQQVPQLFVLGGKPLGKNKWLLKSVSPSDFTIDSNGQILGLILSLEFEEYVRAGSAAASSSAGSSSKTAGVKVNVQDQIASLVLSSEEKKAMKRQNPGI